MKFIKLILLILIIFTFNSIFSHEGESVFSHKGKHFQLKECRSDIDPLKPVVIKNSLPVYPRQALEKAIEANVLLEFTVNKEGNVEDPKVIWFDQTASKKDLFSRSSLRAASKLKYKPGKTESGEPISTPGVKTIMIYRVEGYDDVLEINSHTFDRVTKKIRVTDISPKSMTVLEDALEDISLALKKDNLTSIKKAAFLYIKATTLFKLDRPSEEIKQALLESKSYYGDDFIDTLSGGMQVRGVTSAKLQTFGGLLLSNIYYEEEDWKSVEHEMLEVINSTQLNMMSKRYYSSYMQLGVASYTLENWCTSVTAFEKAKKIAEIENLEFPNNLDKAIEYAKTQMELVK
tara:strand:+ start:2075 stop:3115 length:1041 start_codon:yes stop_codon:yes gene_type:complete